MRCWLDSVRTRLNDVCSVNVGVTPITGLNFAEYIVDFDTKILQPFREFLSVVYRKYWSKVGVR